MLNHEDYRSLKSSIKGWNRRRLARYGIAWPPKHGWRQALLRQYEGCSLPAEKRAVPNFTAPKKKFSTADQLLDDLLRSEKMLTSKWYQRISGSVIWGDGEREDMECMASELAAQIDQRIGKREIGELSDVLDRQD